MTRKTHRFAGFILLCGALLLSACASGPELQVQTLGTQHYPPTALVEVLSAAPPQPYLTIARLQIRGTSGQSPAQLLSALQAKAAALGANAIIVQDQTQTLPPTVNYNPSGGQYIAVPGQTIPAFSAQAIRFTDNPPVKP
ncbi:MAG: hypothetical protein ACP5RC_01720 [Halothiobacillaceae bacterium]